MSRTASVAMSTKRTRAVALWLVAFCLVAGGRAEAVPAAQRLPPPEHIPQDTRAELKTRMTRHGEVMSNLVRSVVLLDRPTIRLLATRIADEEVIARVGSSREQPPQLPRDFFTAQEELTANARQLAAAAVQGGDDKILAERFGAVTRSCVACHSAYLHGRPDFGALAPKPKDAPARK